MKNSLYLVFLLILPPMILLEVFNLRCLGKKEQQTQTITAGSVADLQNKLKSLDPTKEVFIELQINPKAYCESYPNTIRLTISAPWSSSQGVKDMNQIVILSDLENIRVN